ncbi:MAG: SMC family ATPase, partial [Coprobacillus sp.]
QEISKKEQTTKIQLDKLKTVYQKLNDDYALLVKRMERDQDNIEQLPQLQLELQKNEQLVNEMNQRRISIHELSDLFDNYTHILDDHYGYTERYKAASQKYLEMNEKYHQEDENFKCQQAGILAKTLEDNKPCPVCGSIQHPTPAHISQRVLTSQELEQLSHDVEKQKEVKEDTYQQVLLQNQRVQDIKTQITLLKRQLNIQEDLTKEVF